MKVINDDNKYLFYSDNLIVMDKLPSLVFKVGFSKQLGFYLYESSNIEVKEKVYGCLYQKVEKIMKSFKNFQRNLGVILSGDKGIGKSLCAKLICEKALKEGLPVILINEQFSGVSNFISSISQECVVIFDEFDKTFESNPSSEGASQTEFLTLFDGFDQGKKLFVVTCNDIRGLNDFLINRPGRFHYHLRFEYPTDFEIREYLTDKLDPSLYSAIDSVISFSHKFDVNFDTLRAIAYELNSGESLSSAIRDLNIIKEQRTQHYSGTIYLDTGEEVKFNNIGMDIFDEDVFDLYLDSAPIGGVANAGISVWFVPSDIVYQPTSNEEILSGQDVSDIEFYFRDEEEGELSEKYKNVKVTKVVFRKRRSKDLHYVI